MKPLFLTGLIVCLGWLGSSAQIPFFTAEQQFIREATDSILFIVREDYLLKSDSSGETFDLGGKGYFGRSISLAALSDSLLWFSNNPEKPWLTDQNFLPFWNIDTLYPVLSEIWIRNTAEKEFKPSELFFDTLNPGDSTGIFSAGLEMTSAGIIAGRPCADNGWLVVVYTQEKIEDKENAELHFSIYHPQIKPGAGTSYIPVKPPAIQQNIIGGAYFTTEVSVGIIRLKLAGMLGKILRDWYIIPLPEKGAGSNE